MVSITLSLENLTGAKRSLPRLQRRSQIVETLPAVLHDQRRLATLEPGFDLSMLPLTLVASSGSLAVA